MNFTSSRSVTVVDRGSRSRLQLAFQAALALLIGGCAASSQPSTFVSPDAAVAALVTALEADDTARLLTIMGRDGEEILDSGDEVADRQRRQQFLAMYKEKHLLTREEPDASTLVIGKLDWPFPVPIVRGEKGWYFDSEAGQEEILNRRIGGNELSVIEVCKAIRDAQQEYAERDPEGSGLHEYAQKFASDPGRRNGLYWPAAKDQPQSPLGEFAANATAEGYKRKAEGPTPYHGYYYRLLKAQGPAAPNGAINYVVKDHMVLGFAVVAYPAAYGNSGIMTFIMGSDGVVYQRDLGEQTAGIAAAMQEFNPDERWKKVDDVCE